jgi:hypothetical protein
MRNKSAMQGGDPMRIFLVTITLIITLAQPIYAVPTKAPSQDSVVTNDRDLENVNILRAQLEITKSFQNNLLQTVYWSLGMLTTLAALLVGFGWYANFKVYERDKQSLIQEVHSLAAVEFEKLRLSIETQAKESIKLISDQITKETQDKITSLKNQIQTINVSLDNKINTHVNSMKDDLLSLDIELKKIDHEKWIKRGVLGNAFSCAVRMLEPAIHIQNVYEISSTLDLLNSDLDMIRTDKSEANVPDALDITELTKLLSRLGSDHLIMANTIKGKLVNLKIVK